MNECDLSAASCVQVRAATSRHLDESERLKQQVAVLSEQLRASQARESQARDSQESGVGVGE